MYFFYFKSFSLISWDFLLLPFQCCLPMLPWAYKGTGVKYWNCDFVEKEDAFCHQVPDPGDAAFSAAGFPPLVGLSAEQSITFGFPMFNHLSRRPAICASHFLNLELLYISFLPPRPCYWLTHSVTDTFYIRIWLSTSLLKSDWNHPVLLQTWSEWKNLSLQYQIFRRICKPLSTPGDGSATWDLE